MSIHVTDSNFEQEVINSDIPVVVDFFAEWCGPCKMMSPVIDKLSEKYAGKVKVLKLDVDKNNVTAQKYRVMSIPTILFFKNGKLIDQVVGALPEETLDSKISSL